MLELDEEIYKVNHKGKGVFMAPVEGPFINNSDKNRDKSLTKNPSPLNIKPSTIKSAEVAVKKLSDAANTKEIDEREFYIQLLMQKTNISYDVAASEYDSRI
jgi:hypothetical protein